MQIGIFSKVYARQNVDQVIEAVAADHMRVVQFNFSCAGLDSMPGSIPDEHLAEIRSALDGHGVMVAALSGTFNMAHPDPQAREDGVRRLRTLAESCAALGTDLITICTGTRDPDDMWRAHPGNGTAEAWADMRSTIRAALDVVDAYGVRLAFECEPGNVVRTPDDGVRIINEIGHPALGVILDPANILASFVGSDPRATLHDAVQKLGAHLMLAHAKDLDAAGEPCACGTGIVPWGPLIADLSEAGFDGAIVMHGLEERDVEHGRKTLESAGAFV